ncbi:hypothetical protein ACFOET_02305 [Parapedobacter deserti]|uniref:Uncharacterized protein n=2 Tax=Parapedobacter deserti TaxID=1912957 RepID=A0ABV7JHT0_9SPHI
MNTPKVYLVVFLLWLSSSTACQTQPTAETEEQQLSADLDRWMAPYRNEKKAEFVDWIAAGENNPKAALAHPVTRHMQAFVEENKERYLRLRLTGLEALPPIPEIFPGYEVLDLQVLDDYFQKDGVSVREVIDLTSALTAARTLGPGGTLASVNLLHIAVSDHLTQEKEMHLQEYVQLYGLGWLYFADLIKDTQWKVALVNRAFVIEYSWDYATGRIELLKVLVYTGGKQQPGWLAGRLPKALTPQQKLLNKVDEFKWTLYDHVYPDFDFREVENRQRQFLAENRAAYTALRNATLGRYPSIRPERWAEFVQEDLELTEEMRSDLGLFDPFGEHRLPESISINEFKYSQVLSTATYVLGSDNPGNGWMADWLLGKEVYARELDENLWEIQLFVGDVAFGYQWNTATDELNALTVRRKEKQ